MKKILLYMIFSAFCILPTYADNTPDTRMCETTRGGPETGKCDGLNENDSCVDRVQGASVATCRPGCTVKLTCTATECKPGYYLWIHEGNPQGICRTEKQAKAYCDDIRYCKTQNCKPKFEQIIHPTTKKTIWANTGCEEKVPPKQEPPKPAQPVAPKNCTFIFNDNAKIENVYVGRSAKRGASPFFESLTHESNVLLTVVSEYENDKHESIIQSTNPNGKNYNTQSIHHLFDLKAINDKPLNEYGITSEKLQSAGYIDIICNQGVPEFDIRPMSDQPTDEPKSQEAKLICTVGSNCDKTTMFADLDGMLNEFFAEKSSSVWKNDEGKFNTARLASDSIAGVVLGTAGGIITSKVIKKNQLKQGFEDLKCTIGGQTVASFGDEFNVGLR